MGNLAELMRYAHKVTLTQGDNMEFPYSCEAWFRLNGERKVSLRVGETVGEAVERALEEVKELCMVKEG